MLFAYIGLTMYNLFALSLRNGRVVRSISQPHRRLWARLQTVGWGLGTAYDANECIYVMLRRSPFAHNAPYDRLLAKILLTSFLVTILSGAGLGLLHWLGQYRALRQLYPLWRDLYRVTPQIALDPPSSEGADTVAFRDVGFRLYRRVTEIHDGITALESYSDASMTEKADRVYKQMCITRQQAGVTVEALMLAQAIHAKQGGNRTSEPLLSPLMTMEENLEHEVQHLKGVARAYRGILVQGREALCYALSEHPDSQEAIRR